jgi:D-amino peptidase
MKIYISADIEGVTGVDHWDEATKGRPGYEESVRQFSAEVNAACEGAIEAGAVEIVLQDAHDSARNLLLERLPEAVKVIRGWSDHPRCMAQELDESFSALVLVGAHSASGSAGNPLAHTFSLENASVRINGELASETRVLQYTAAYYGVPLVFLSGDRLVCEDALHINPGLTVVAVKEGIGNSVLSLHPAFSVKRIREGVAAALSAGIRKCRVSLPALFRVEIAYRHAGRAYKTGFYPGMSRKDDFTLVFETEDFFEVLRMFLFAGY